jgi:hypothetical protein
MGYSSRTMHHVIRHKLFRIGSRSILESSYKGCGHHVCPTWTQSSIYGTWWRGLFIPKILHLQIPGSGYPGGIVHHLSRVLLFTYGIDDMLSCCTSLGLRRSYTILGIYSMTSGTWVYIWIAIELWVSVFKHRWHHKLCWRCLSELWAGKLQRARMGQ